MRNTPKSINESHFSLLTNIPINKERDLDANRAPFGTLDTRGGQGCLLSDAHKAISPFPKF